MLKSLLFIFLITGAQLAIASESTFQDFQKILNKHLVEKTLSQGGFESHFNYLEAIKDQDTLKLIESQNKKLSSFDIKTLNSKEKANSFWINSYNFFMIKIVLKKGFKGKKLNINSVKDLGSYFSPYKIFTKKINTVAGQNYSLDQIEKEILLGSEYKKKGWKDARIHFAVNCASVGCPPLIKPIYTANNLNHTLDTNLKKALKTQRHFDFTKKRISLTHLFKWYKKDFVEHSGSVKKFISPFLEEPNQRSALEKTSSFDYIDYNWKLNRPENF